MLVLAAKVWTFWMGVAVFGLVLVSTVGLLAGYLMKVVKPKYPPRTGQP